MPKNPVSKLEKDLQQEKENLRKDREILDLRQKLLERDEEAKRLRGGGKEVKVPYDIEYTRRDRLERSAPSRSTDGLRRGPDYRGTREEAPAPEPKTIGEYNPDTMSIKIYNPQQPEEAAFSPEEAPEEVPREPSVEEVEALEAERRYEQHLQEQAQRRQTNREEITARLNPFSADEAPIPARERSLQETEDYAAELHQEQMLQERDARRAQPSPGGMPAQPTPEQEATGVYSDVLPGGVEATVAPGRKAPPYGLEVQGYEESGYAADVERYTRTQEMLELYPGLDPETAEAVAMHPEYSKQAVVYAADAKAQELLSKALVENNAQLSEDNMDSAMRQAAFAKESYDDLSRRLDQLDQMQVDPSRLWNNASTGHKIGMVMGIVLSGLAGGGRSNAALNIIENAINRDIDAQKANINLARGNFKDRANLYQQGLEMFKDERLASLMVYKKGMADAQAKAQAILDQVSDERQALGLQNLIQEAEMKRRKAAAEIDQINTEIALNKGKTQSEIIKNIAQAKKYDAEARTELRKGRGSGKSRLAGTPLDPNAVTSPYDRTYTIGRFDKSIPASTQKEARETLQAATRAAYLLNEMEDLMQKGVDVVTKSNTDWADWLETPDGKVLKRKHGQYAKALARAQNGARVSDFDLKFELEAMPIDTLLTKKDQALAVLQSEQKQLSEELRWNLNMLPGFDLEGKSVDEIITHVTKPRDYSGDGGAGISRSDLKVYADEGTPAATTSAAARISAAMNRKGMENLIAVRDTGVLTQLRDNAERLAKELEGEAAKRQRRNAQIFNRALTVKNKEESKAASSNDVKEKQKEYTEKLRSKRVDRPR